MGRSSLSSRRAPSWPVSRSFFESSFSASIAWTDLASLELSAGAPARRLELAGELDDSIVGDVTSRFEPSEPFSFLAP